MTPQATQAVGFYAITGGADGQKEALTSRASVKSERLTELAQTKLTPSEFARLERIRDTLNEGGIKGVTISSLLRTFAVHGIGIAEDELGLNQ